MSCKRASKRSLDDWMEMVTACRQSGMTDADWCAEHGIAPSSFYNAVTRLRKQACQIPDPIKKVSTLDLTSRRISRSKLLLCYRTGEFSGRTASKSHGQFYVP